ncbi:MAG TPA: ABC transporter ATP-binding protein, partial [Tabrizicola sp.]|nr:ABC transporter ATP-binding protein [Tabrizicola sp.]
GLDTPDTGDVLIDGHPVQGVGTERAIIFQEPRLLPWLTVLGNASFGLTVRGLTLPEAEARARHYIRLVGLANFEAAYPRQLSGGMAQRVGIARALTVQPEILLLDEPLGALDAMTKLTMQEELARIWREETVTMVLVTHDLEEAIFLADRVLVLPKDNGEAPRLIDIDLPRPRDRSEGRFVSIRKRLLAEFGLH